MNRLAMSLLALSSIMTAPAPPPEGDPRRMPQREYAPGFTRGCDRAHKPRARARCCPRCGTDIPGRDTVNQA